MGTGGISRRSPYQYPLHASPCASQGGAPLHFSSLCSVLCKRQTFNSYSWHLLFLIGGGSALGWMPSAGPMCSARPRFRPGRSSEWLAEAGHGGGEEAPLKSALSMQCTDRGLRCLLLTEASPCSALLSGLSSSPWQLVAELMLARTLIPDPNAWTRCGRPLSGARGRNDIRVPHRHRPSRHPDHPVQ